MKQILLPLVFMLMPVAASAQQSAHPQVSAPVEQSLRFGYFSYEEVLHTMPEIGRAYNAWLCDSQA